MMEWEVGCICIPASYPRTNFTHIHILFYATGYHEIHVVHTDQRCLAWRPKITYDQFIQLEEMHKKTHYADLDIYNFLQRTLGDES